MDDRLSAAIARLGVGPYKPGSSATQGYIYNPLPFPGCENISCHRPNSHERWQLIRSHTSFKDKRVLDVGCATGYFSFKSIEAGAGYVFGLDQDLAALHVCEVAADVYDIKNASFSTFLLKDTEFDVAFAMSVLNWMGKELAETWMAWASTHVKTTFIEIPIAGDGRGGAKWLRDHAAVHVWLSQYMETEFIGSTSGPHRGKPRSLFTCTSREQDNVFI